jgi:hypothetical protein
MPHVCSKAILRLYESSSSAPNLTKNLSETTSDKTQDPFWPFFRIFLLIFPVRAWTGNDAHSLFLFTRKNTNFLVPFYNPFCGVSLLHEDARKQRTVNKAVWQQL